MSHKALLLSVILIVKHLPEDQIWKKFSQQDGGRADTKIYELASWYSIIKLRPGTCPA